MTKAKKLFQGIMSISVIEIVALSLKKVTFHLCGGKTPPACTQVASTAEVSLSLGAE